MAKTLVGLYDTLTDAEHVVHALGMEGFPRGGIRVAAPHSTARHGTGASVGEWITAESTTDMVGHLDRPRGPGGRGPCVCRGHSTGWGAGDR